MIILICERHLFDPVSPNIIAVCRIFGAHLIANISMYFHRKANDIVRTVDQFRAESRSSGKALFYDMVPLSSGTGGP